jgi:triacylglycerol lipase
MSTPSEYETAASDLAEKIRALGTEITPQAIGGTIALYAPLHEGLTYPGLTTTRDLAYGPAERHRLDIFAAGTGGSARPVLLFVHGGGFIGGDKTAHGSPFYDNVGQWAARHGMLGVTMTYRLAPEHRWPAGSEDVGRAVRWLREHVASHAGDPNQIFVMGQSAGAVHVAGYVAREHSSSSQGWRPAGAILVSGLYDTRTMEKNSYFEAYFGNEAEIIPGVSFLEPLARTEVPLMLVLAQFDPRDFQRQAVALNGAYVEQHQHWPRFVQLTGHNHLSTVYGLDTPGDALGPHILAFARASADGRKVIGGS